MRKVILMAAALAANTVLAADDVTVNVTNTTPMARVNEMVEVSLSDVKGKLGHDATLIVTDADGKEIPSQVTHDGKIIFQTGVPAKGKSVYHIRKGKPANYETKAKGRLFTERGDEFGWENDCVAFRIYGHGAASGYDLFNKSTDELMLDYWYASEQNQEMRSVSRQLAERGYQDLADQVYNAFCYHIDHGKGMDCYTVGPTLGCGANALVNKDGSLCMPKCYKKYEILDNGPLRFTVRLTYPAIDYQGAKIEETRVVTLDAGSQFNKVSVSYAGLSSNVSIASGVVIHKQNPTAYVMSKDNGYVGYEDLGDASVYNKKYRDELSQQMGKIYVGTVYPGKLSETSVMDMNNGIAVGHAVGTATYSDGYTYYFGTGWSKNPATGFDSLAKWEAHLSDKAKKVRNPLRIKIKK